QVVDLLGVEVVRLERVASADQLELRRGDGLENVPQAPAAGAVAVEHPAQVRGRLVLDGATVALAVVGPQLGHLRTPRQEQNRNTARCSCQPTSERNITRAS